jgi:hypothetical protein
VTAIHSLASLGISGIHEEIFEVTRFRRVLQPTKTRKKPLLQFYAHDASIRLHKADYQAGGRLRTVSFDDIADVR